MAVTMNVVGAAAIGGLVMGGLSIVGQGISNGFDDINIGTVAIDTFTGAAYGAITGAVGAGAGLGSKVLGAAGKVALATTSAGLHGLNEGKNWSSITNDVGTAFIVNTILQSSFVAGGAILSKLNVSGQVVNKNFQNLVNIVRNINGDIIAKTSIILSGSWLYQFINGKYN